MFSWQSLHLLWKYTKKVEQLQVSWFYFKCRRFNGRREKCEIDMTVKEGEKAVEITRIVISHTSKTFHLIFNV